MPTGKRRRVCCAATAFFDEIQGGDTKTSPLAARRARRLCGTPPPAAGPGRSSVALALRIGSAVGFGLIGRSASARSASWLLPWVGLAESRLRIPAQRCGHGHGTAPVAGVHPRPCVHPGDTHLDRRGHQRCRACMRAAEARRQRDYSDRKVARCSSCFKPSFPSMKILADGSRVQQPSQLCCDCRRARRNAARSGLLTAANTARVEPRSVAAKFG
jgi:hypothetical protein